MNSIISYLSDFMNGWTLVDVVLITIGFALAIKYYKKSSNYFLDIIGIGKKIADLNDLSSEQLRKIISLGSEISELKDELLKVKEELLASITSEASLIAKNKELSDNYNKQSERLQIKIEELNLINDELLASKEDFLTSANENRKLREDINILKAKVSHKKYVPLSEQKPKAEQLIWKCKTDIYGDNILKGNSYKLSGEKHGKMPNITKTTLTLIGEKGTPVLVDRCNFDA